METNKPIKPKAKPKINPLKPKSKCNPSIINIQLIITLIIYSLDPSYCWYARLQLCKTGSC